MAEKTQTNGAGNADMPPAYEAQPRPDATPAAPETLEVTQPAQSQSEPATAGVNQQGPTQSASPMHPEKAHHPMGTPGIPGHPNPNAEIFYEAQVVTPLHQLTDTPLWINCPFCNKRTKTQSSVEGTAMQILSSVLCCLICVPLVCLPCVCHWFEETNIFCSACRNRVAVISDGDYGTPTEAAVQKMRQQGTLPTPTQGPQPATHK
ncbi:Uu.00g100350.m01.CDS01 [Anthostomella pinea]|uniref:Uu.00g100350.m01.CDS01 n=1 Tax=Anthostomella pinea TaxID=933095 RepID=A0AAI8VCX5_9PEZI|nr:Uu.00g100350.m01.CDS01 [Anthostomella pinea]